MCPAKGTNGWNMRFTMAVSGYRHVKNKGGIRPMDRIFP
jgi:hypothetical protein